MTESEKERSEGTNWLGLLSFGFFLALLGTIWVVTPNLTEEVSDFFADFQLKNVTENIIFPAPEHNHPVVYTAATQFCFIFGAFQIVILALRFILNESLNRKTETLSGMVFLFSAGFFLYMLSSEAIGWFSFLAGLIISAGLAIVTSSIVKLLR